MTQEATEEFITLVNRSAEGRGEVSIERKYIELALKKINSGEISVARYPTGAPSLKEVYEQAFKLMPRQ